VTIVGHRPNTPISTIGQDIAKTTRGPIAPGDSEEARRRGIASGEARRAKLQRTTEEVAADALAGIVRQLEHWEIPADGRNVGGIVRALLDVVRERDRVPEAAAIAADVVAHLQRLASARGGQGKANTPAAVVVNGQG
jgi:hypothetical protein